METTSFDEILKEEKPETPEAPSAPEAPEAAETDFEKEEKRSRKRAHQAKEFEAQGRDPDTGQYIPREEKKEEKAEVKTEEKKEQPKVELTDKEKAYLKAVEEERRKRQDLERRLAELEKAKPQPEKTEEKTFWDDPEGHLKNWEQRLSQREVALDLKVSERIARSKYTDFDDKVTEFAEALRTTPGLHAQWLASPDPAEFAYKHGALRKEMREVGDVDKLREKIRQEERTRLEAEFKKKQEELEKQRQELPGSLSDVKGASKKSAVVWNGPPPMEEILKP